MKKNKQIPFALLCTIAFFALGSCRKDIPQTQDSTDERIVFAAGSEKGSMLTDANLESVYGQTGISIRALRSSRDFFGPDEKLVCNSPGSWTTREPYYWPSDADNALDFWAWASDKISPQILQDGMHFHYAMPDSASQQSDILLGSKLSATKENSSPNGVELSMVHPLSAVAIKMGRTNKGRLKSVSFHGVCTEADCHYDLSGGVMWDNYSDKSEVSQDFDMDIQANLSGSWAQDVSSGEKGQSEGTLFMMIPQNLEGVTLQVDFQREGSSTVETFRREFGGVWSSGYSYTYLVGVTGGLHVVVEGEFGARSAKDVFISNEGTSACTVRCTVVGVWLDADGRVIQPLSGSGIVVDRDPQWDEYWSFDGENHIYTYKYPLQSGESTAVALFDSVTIPEGPQGATLDMRVLVQARQYS